MAKSSPLSEHQIQSQLMAELTYKLRPDVWCSAVPNGGFRRKTEASRLKKEGVKSGMADLVFIAPKGISGWLEMKRPGGSLSDTQVGFGAMCRRNGHLYGVAKSVDEAIKIIGEWGFLRINLGGGGRGGLGGGGRGGLGGGGRGGHG